MSLEGPKTPELQVTNDTFKNMDKDIAKQGEAFIKKIKNKQENEETKNIFNDNSTAVLTSICDSMLTNFETIDATKLQTYKNAKIAFEEDMKTLGITNNKDLLKNLQDLQDLIDLKQINTITDKARLEELLEIADTKKTAKDTKIQNIENTTEDTKIQNMENTTEDTIKDEKEHAKREKVIAEIETKIAAINEQEESKINTLKNMNITKENAKTFFEGNQTTYNAFLEQVFKETNTPPSTENKITIKNDSKGNANTLYERVKTYTEITDLGDITVGKAGAFDNKDGINARFGKEERVIQYTKGTEKKFLVQGSYKEMQERIAENNKDKITEPINRTTQYRKTKTGKIFKTEAEAKAEGENTTEEKKYRDTKSSLNVFDDIGNFAAFKLYLNNPEFTDNITSNLGQILKQITEYTPSTDTADAKDGKTTELKNGYANVMTDYIINNVTDASMLEVYMSYISVNNLNLLGADQPTRSANYTKLFFSDANKGTIRPQIENLMKTKGDSYKMNLLQKIANVKNAIEGPKVKGFDSLIQAFGPMVISILKLLGFGKSSLLKIFPQAKDKINEQFKKEYELNKKQKEFIDDINKNDNFPKTSNPKNKIRLDTGDELKKHFTKIGEYKTLIEAKDNITNINVNVFQKGLNIYNKKQKEEKADHIDININDIVTIETKKVDGRQKQFITGIKPNKDNEVKAVIDTIIDADETRARIASANTAIQTPSKDNPSINEQGIDNQAKTKYKISNQNDIARYLTASLFSDKDLDYVMTENYLDNGEVITNSTATDGNTAEVKTDKPELKFIDKMYDGTLGVTATGATKMIHEVIDMNNAPDKIIIIQKGKAVSVTKKEKYKEGNKEITTYIKDDNKRVQILEGDKIEEVEPEVKTAATTPTPTTTVEEATAATTETTNTVPAATKTPVAKAQATTTTTTTTTSTTTPTETASAK